ncbi:hypothetical protein HanRHA438_Chr06g0251601 [Helianthus annuus]|nr:hypothetical protein HanRHA438_Chr06g0251601 [Helianthus annuus]
MLLLTKGQFYSVLTQILFVSGVMTTIGVQSSLQFFTKRGNFKVLLISFYIIKNMFMCYHFHRAGGLTGSSLSIPTG